MSSDANSEHHKQHIPDHVERGGHERDAHQGGRFHEQFHHIPHQEQKDLMRHMRHIAQPTHHLHEFHIHGAESHHNQHSHHLKPGHHQTEQIHKNQAAHTTQSHDAKAAPVKAKNEPVDSLPKLQFKTDDPSFKGTHVTAPDTAGGATVKPEIQTTTTTVKQADTRTDTKTDARGLDAGKPVEQPRAEAMKPDGTPAAGVEAKLEVKGDSPPVAEVKKIAAAIYDLPERLMKALESNEGNFTSYTPNDRGHGLSVGIRQWNQKGELPQLLHDWHDKNPAKFDEIFGKYSEHLQDPNWVYHARKLGYNKDFREKMNTALADPEFQQVQTDTAKQFAQHSVERAKGLGLRSELGAAIVADFENQMGLNGSAWALGKVGLHPNGDAVSHEESLLKRLGKIIRRPNGKQRLQQLYNFFSPTHLIDAPPDEPKT